MKKAIVGILLLSSINTFASETRVLVGMSLEASALAIEDFQSEGLSAKRLNSSQCGQDSSSRGNFCVVASSSDKTFVLYGMSLDATALAIEDFESEGLKAKRLNSRECGQVSSRGQYCVIAESK